MGKKIPEIDAYIERSAEFAQPLLKHLRGLVHKAVPKVEEGIKWGMPYFAYADGPLCHMAAFKAHCVFGFPKAPLMKSEIISAESNAMGSFGRITSKKDLPKDSELIAAIKEAAALNDAGVKVPRGARPMPEPELHPSLLAALKQNKAAKKHFDEFPPGRRREYVEWIADAKTDATREKRIAQAVEWISEGKSRNWKYEKKSPNQPRRRRAGT